MPDALFSLRVNEVDATMRHRLDAPGADLRQTYGIGADRMTVNAARSIATSGKRLT